MNTITHFLSAYLLGRAIKIKNGSFYLFFLSIAGIFPDVDTLIHFAFPNFVHGVFTHTILGGLLFAMILVGITTIIMYPVLKTLKMSVNKLIYLAVLGLFVHLFLDIFTYAPPIEDDLHHLYFWPLSDYSVHMNIIWPSVTYAVRVWVEIIYTGVIAGIILIYFWHVKKEDLSLIILPKTDFSLISNNENYRIRRRFYVFIGIFISCLIILIFY